MWWPSGASKQACQPLPWVGTLVSFFAFWEFCFGVFEDKTTQVEVGQSGALWHKGFTSWGKDFVVITIFIVCLLMEKSVAQILACRGKWRLDSLFISLASPSWRRLFQTRIYLLWVLVFLWKWALKLLLFYHYRNNISDWKWKAKWMYIIIVHDAYALMLFPTYKCQYMYKRFKERKKGRKKTTTRKGEANTWWWEPSWA